MVCLHDALHALSHGALSPRGDYLHLLVSTANRVIADLTVWLVRQWYVCMMHRKLSATTRCQCEEITCVYWSAQLIVI